MPRKGRDAPPGWPPLAREVAAGAIAALFLVSFSFAASSFPSLDIDRGPLREHVEAVAKRARYEAAAAARSTAGVIPPAVEGVERGVDILSYDVSFDIDPAVRFLSGTTAIRVAGFARQTSSLALDLDDAYAVTETLRDGKAVAAVHASGKLVVPFVPPLGAEERATISVSDRGLPPGAAALDFWQHGAGYAATSVAEPFLARTFWPCVDDPKDKAVATVHATVPAGYVVASAGTVSVADAGSGRSTYTWKLPQAISTYLVSLNVANYVTVEDTYTALDGRKMPIRSYLLPEYAAGNVARLSAIKDHIATQASMFGEYPFLDTKYGIVASAFSGGMEHPTMTSIGTDILADTARNITTLLVHELSHDWWGDRVTMRTWDDIWLNEGFATYGEVLYLEKTLGVAPGATLSANYDDNLYGGRLAPPVVADPAAPFANTGAVYYKGARALHMLRRLMGDATFFPSLRAYGDAHAWGTASRADLRGDFEKASGLDLKQFFDQWVETPFRPILRATYQNAPDASSVTLAVTQTQGHTVVHPSAALGDRPYYVIPLLVRVTVFDGTTFDVIVNLDGAAPTTTVTVPNPSKKFVAGIALDPEKDLLRIVESTGPA
ncbi:MAG TPA: M1 family metallopeptidase [Thermoanaerobaculia bacterium]|nr:M1 family metallopeptidase [Thermoanaerobaculia bacterium]